MARKPYPGERPADWTPPEGVVEAPKSSTGRNVAIGCGTIVAVLVVLGVIGAIVGPAPDGGSSSEVATAADPTIGAMPVDAGELWRDYQANEVAAQSKYGGKKLLVSGTIDSIALDFKDDPFVTFVSDNEFMATMADLANEDKAKVGALSKGQPLTVLCERVSEIAGRPMLSNCRIS